MSEAELAEPLVAYLESLGTVYQEVTVRGGVADIVVRVGAEIWIVEVKTSLSLALVAQAMDRRRLAHRVYVACPPSRSMREVAALLEEIGIGLFVISVDWNNKPRIEERVAARRLTSKPVALGKKLCEQHRTHAKAGSVGAGGRWTPWLDTCEQLAALARANPGIALKAAIEEIRHHYSSKASARSSLARWISEGKVPGVRLVDGTLQPEVSC